MRFLINILVLQLLISCAGVDVDKDKLSSPPFRPELKIFDSGDSLSICLTYIVTDNKKSGKKEFVQSLESTEVNMLLNKRVVNRVKMANFLLTNDISDSIRVLAFASIGKFAWSNPKTRPEEYSVQVLLKTNNKMYSISRPYRTLVTDMQTDKLGKMDLIPFDSKLDSTAYIFGLIAIRRDTVENEYLPGSENIRAKIFSPKGKVYWESNYNLNYTTQIEKVKPEKIGEAYIYTLLWNGLSNSKQQMPTKDYKINLSIPALPKPYYIFMDFMPELEW